MSFNNYIELSEPEWGKNMLIYLNNYAHQHACLLKILPITADIFVFSYPIYLCILYIIGIKKENHFMKQFALYIFFSNIFTICMNLFIQYLIFKKRPEQLIFTQDQLILHHLPDKPFPSDHAALSATIAMSTMLIAIYKKNYYFLILSILFWICSFIMCMSRIIAGVHWPTDILGGLLIGILSASILRIPGIFKFMSKYIYDKLIKIELKIMLLLVK